MVIDFNSLYEHSNDLERFFEDVVNMRLLPGTRRAKYPQVNILENENEYVVDISAPGIPADEIELVITARNLVIKGERKSPEGRYFRQERMSGAFQRVLTLNVPVDRDKVTAKSSNGILRVTLPKAEAATPRKINISYDSI